MLSRKRSSASGAVEYNDTKHMRIQVLPRKKYDVLQKIGEGTYGAVYKVRNPENGQLMAIKRIRLEKEVDGLPATAIREVALLKSLHHVNIVGLFEVGVTATDMEMVFEYVDKDLKMYLDSLTYERRALSPREVQWFAFQLLYGLAYAHSQDVIHRDLKPQNLLVSREGCLKIADFGLARLLRSCPRTLTHEVVTLWYRAPEILLGAAHYDMKIDIWSAGVIILEMLLMAPPFPGDSEIDQMYRIFRILGTPTEENWPGVSSLKDYNKIFPRWKSRSLRLVLEQRGAIDTSPEVVDLLENMLAMNPRHRPAAHEVLMHPYFKDVRDALNPLYKDPSPVKPPTHHAETQDLKFRVEASATHTAAVVAGSGGATVARKLSFPAKDNSTASPPSHQPEAAGTQGPLPQAESTDALICDDETWED